MTSDQAPGPTSPVPIRLVYLIGQLGLGGSERQLLVLLEHLDRERHECCVIVFHPSPEGELHRELEGLGVTVVDVPEGRRGVFARLVFLYRAFRRLRPHVVHSWSAYANPYAGLAGRLARVPVRLGSLRTTLHSTLMEDLPRLYRWLLLRSIGCLVVNSEKCAGELREWGLADRRIELLRNCVPLPALDEEPAVDLSALGIEPEHRLVGLVGNLRAVKDHLFFIDAMAGVLSGFPELRVLLIGQPLPSEPDYPRWIEERIASHSLQDRVVLTGFRPDVPALVRRMEVLCLTSKSEGMPNVLLEAMAAARPVVATRVGGVPELVCDGENGFLIEPGDAAGFAGAVSRLLRDPDLARRMAENGRVRAAQDHDCSQAAGRLASFYRQALGGSPGR